MLVKYISIKNLIGRFLKEYGLEDTSYVEDMPQWTEDAIQIMGISNYYVYKYKLTEVKDSKVLMPCDLENLQGVFVATSLQLAENKDSLKRLFIRDTPYFGKNKGYETTDPNAAYGSFNGCYLHTSFDKGIVYWVYEGVPTDEEGFPLVPRDARVNTALQYYFIARMSLSGFVHPVLSYADAMALWTKEYPAAANSVNWMDTQDYQDFSEMWTNPLIGDLHANHYIH